MSVHSFSDRLTRCLIAAGILGGICFAYVTLSSRVLDVQRRQQKRPRAEVTRSTKSVADESVFRWFPQSSWVRSANSLREGSRYLFFQKESQEVVAPTVDSDTPGMAIELRPIAMLWKNNDPDVRPIVATADSARVDLSERLSLQPSSDGGHTRLVSGWLTGNVVVQGPKNLQISGQEFYVDEQSMKLRSLHPVDFAFEGHTGRAEGGVEIDLQRDPGDTKGLTSVNGISRVTLNGPLICDLKFHDDDPDRNSTHLEIQAPSHFTFDLRSNIGTFFGRRGGGQNTENRVVVKRFTDREPDHLYCPQLVVEFHPRIKPDTGEAERSRLQLGKVSARGRGRSTVVYLSAEHNLKASMMQLDYHVGAKQLDMFGELQDTKEPLPDELKNLRIKITQDGRTLRVPHLRMLHGDGNVVERIECRGRGHVTQNADMATPTASQPADKTIATEVVWNRQLSVQRAADGQTHTIAIDGNGIVSLPDRGMKLSGHTIDLTVHTPQTESDDQTSREDGSISLNLSDARPEKLVARGNVILRSPQASGEIRQQLTCYFDSTADDNRVKAISQSRTVSSPSDPFSPQQQNDDESQEYTEFSGREMSAHIIIPEDSDAPQRWDFVRLSGDVKVTHRSKQDKGQYTALGSTFKAENGLGDMADIMLEGSPARLMSPAGKVVAARINLYQAQGRAEINGAGRLQMIMDQDFDGKQLPRPVPMNIFWKNSMGVQGRQAHFVGKIRIEMDKVQYSIDDEQVHDTVLRAPELIVEFNEPLNLSGGPSVSSGSRGDSRGSGTPTLKEIRCVGRTLIHQESFTDGKMDGLLDAEVVDLTLEPDTGDFNAIGPGMIETTNTTTSSSRPNRLRPEARIRVRANTRTEVNESPFARVKATFIESISGNLNNRETQLKYSVNICYAPVEDLDEEIDLESIPAEQMPDDSRMLQADEVHLMAIEGAEGLEFSMKAVGNARLESRDLSGDADIITYDHSKSQIVLRGEDGRLVNGRHRRGETNQYNELNGPFFEYNLKTRIPRGSTVSLRATE